MSAPRFAAKRYEVADRAPRRVREWLVRWESALLVILAVVVCVNSLISPWFLDIYNLSDATANFSEQAIIALPMALLILVREIDLSVAGAIAVASLAIGACSSGGLPSAALIAVGLTVGALCGALNGALVVGLGAPSIVVTIGTMSLFRGVAQIVMQDQAITNYPESFLSIGQEYVVPWPPLRLSFALFLALSLLFGIVLHTTRYGRTLYAIGANPTAARFVGLQVDRVRFQLFVLTGLLAGLASVLLTARIGTTRSNIATGWELSTITMVVLGGVSIEGGAGAIPGVVLAIFVLGTVTWGLSLINVPAYGISTLQGALLIVAIAAPKIIRRAVESWERSHPNVVEPRASKRRQIEKNVIKDLGRVRGEDISGSAS